MNWLKYLLEANLYLGAFYLLYFLLFDRETHYKLNRAYLLFSCIVSYIIPVIQIGALKADDTGEQVVTIIRTNKLNLQRAETAWNFTLQDCLMYAYLFGVLVMFTLLIYKIWQLIRLSNTQKSLLANKYKLVKIENSNTAFSFFNHVFIGTKVSGADTVIRHELVHIDQKHSFDIVFLELIKVINWFNPFIYLLQRSLKTVHEYIADEQTAAYEKDTLTYSAFLVNNAYGITGSSLAHSFFNYNLLKKRIIMLNQKRSGNLARLKYLLALPVCAALLCASTLGFSKNYGVIDLAPKRQPAAITVRAAKTAAAADTAHVTGKGYKFTENGYLIEGKTDYRVIITETNGEQKEYYRNAATAAEKKLLEDKYGYKFPTTVIYAKLPPPPPVSPAQPKVKEIEIQIAPPHPAKPAKAPKSVKIVKFPAPVVKADTVAEVKRVPPPVPPKSVIKQPKSAKIIEVTLLPPPSVGKPDSDATGIKRVPPPPPAPPKNNVKSVKIVGKAPVTKKIDSINLKLSAPVKQ
jgi:beta-lactamase regulating signal transducer with metallopeptidase domain